MTKPAQAATTGWSLRLQGLWWFLWIPATLVILLTLPFGLGISLFLAAGLIALHRRLAAPFVYRHVQSRCLWCGSKPSQPQTLQLRGLVPLVVCQKEKRELQSFLACAHKLALPLRLGILVPVAGYFLLGLLSLLGVEVLPLESRQHLFRVLVACSVLTLAVSYRWMHPEQVDSFPFPIHNLALLGIRWTVWIFLVVGISWIALSLPVMLLAP